MHPVRSKLFFALLALAASTAWGESVRLKDVLNVRGVRSNQLVGVGLVTGLSKSGDSAKSLLTNRAAANMLTRLGLKTTDKEMVSGNLAAVMVTAELPPYAKIGDRIDLRLSTVGDAKSLAGGTLVLTPLRAGDGSIYAMGQGGITVGTTSGNPPQVLTVATVPGGATIEKEFSPVIDHNGRMILSLKDPDFTTNQRVVDVINGHLHGFHAESTDIASITLLIPPPYLGRTVELMSELENLRVDVERRATVVINERTGTIVVGQEVVIQPVTITHGDLSIAVGTAKAGKAAEKKRLVSIGGTTVGKLVESLNAMGTKPADLLSILQTLSAAGALQADLRVM